jgi:hypothetical protein
MGMKERNFVICTMNHGYEASLEVRKVYEVLPDPAADEHAQVRVVDESGEDYLYPDSFFTPVTLSATAVGQLLQAA